MQIVAYNGLWMPAMPVAWRPGWLVPQSRGSPFTQPGQGLGAGPQRMRADNPRNGALNGGGSGHMPAMFRVMFRGLDSCGWENFGAALAAWPRTGPMRCLASERRLKHGLAPQLPSQL